MEKDYLPSRRFPKEVIDSFDIPYVYQDFCVDDYVIYLRCMRLSPKVLENGLAYAVPGLNRFCNCKKYKTQWLKCQEYREREIFDEMRKIHLEQLKKENNVKLLAEKIDNY